MHNDESILEVAVAALLAACAIWLYIAVKIGAFNGHSIESIEEKMSVMPVPVESD